MENANVFRCLIFFMFCVFFFYYYYFYMNFERFAVEHNEIPSVMWYQKKNMHIVLIIFTAFIGYWWREGGREDERKNRRLKIIVKRSNIKC